MAQVVYFEVGSSASPINNRYAWEHAYGGSHYLYNRANASVRAPVAAVTIDQLDESLCAELIRSGFVNALPVNHEASPGWKCPSAPIPEQILRSSHVHYDPQDAQELVLRLSESLRLKAQSHYRCYLRAVKVRLIRLSKGFEGEWHKDNFPTGIFKVLVYLSGCDRRLGTTQVKFDDADDLLISGPAGTLAMFDTNTRLHRALGPSLESDSPDYRYSMEVTFVPAPDESAVSAIPSSSLIAAWPYPDAEVVAFANHAATIIAGGGRKPPDALAKSQVLRRNYAHPPLALNIGGGAQFLQPGWANVDGAFGETNPYPTQFNPTTTFGYPDGAFDFVYTSHTFEHVDMLTFSRLMTEASRVLRRGGFLMVKVPDVESFLLESRTGFVSSGFHRCLCGVQRTWASLGVSFTFWQALSFLVCSAWNSEYSLDIFNDGGADEKPGRYFGPCPGLSDVFLRQLFSMASPGESARILRRLYVDYQTRLPSPNGNWKWGHQNSWSKAELNNDIQAFGYSLVTNERDKILAQISNPPSFFTSQYDISLWGFYRKL
jgi:hypothetical protein